MLSAKKVKALRVEPLTGGTRLKAAMRLAGVTQVQLSEAIGIAQSQVSEDATGKFSEMSLDKARAYAEFFGCAIEDLFPAREGAVA